MYMYIYILLHEKGIQYNYLDMTEMPNKTLTCLRMYCNSFPIVLNMNIHFQISFIFKEGFPPKYS